MRRVCVCARVSACGEPYAVGIGWAGLGVAKGWEVLGPGRGGRAVQPGVGVAGPGPGWDRTAGFKNVDFPQKLQEIPLPPFLGGREN